MGKFYKSFLFCAFIMLINSATFAHSDMDSSNSSLLSKTSLSMKAIAYHLIEKRADFWQHPLILSKQEIAVSVYPNPAVAKTTIAYELSARASVFLRVVDLSGRQLAVLVAKQNQNPGKYEVLFDFDKYHILPGMYIIHMLVDNKTYSKKVIVQ